MRNNSVSNYTSLRINKELFWHIATDLFPKQFQEIRLVVILFKTCFELQWYIDWKLDNWQNFWDYYLWIRIDLTFESHRVPVPCEKMHLFVCVQMYVTKSALWDICLIHCGICETATFVPTRVVLAHKPVWFPWWQVACTFGKSQHQRQRYYLYCHKHAYLTRGLFLQQFDLLHSRCWGDYSWYPCLGLLRVLAWRGWK